MANREDSQGATEECGTKIKRADLTTALQLHCRVQGNTSKANSSNCDHAAVENEKAVQTRGLSLPFIEVWISLSRISYRKSMTR